MNQINTIECPSSSLNNQMINIDTRKNVSDRLNEAFSNNEHYKIMENVVFRYGSEICVVDWLVISASFVATISVNFNDKVSIESNLAKKLFIALRQNNFNGSRFVKYFYNVGDWIHFDVVNDKKCKVSYSRFSKKINRIRTNLNFIVSDLAIINNYYTSSKPISSKILNELMKLISYSQIH